MVISTKNVVISTKNLNQKCGHLNQKCGHLNQKCGSAASTLSLGWSLMAVNDLSNNYLELLEW